MQTFDQALLKLVEEDRVDYEEAIRISSRPQDFKLMVYALGREEVAEGEGLKSTRTTSRIRTGPE
jgi:Tfp pilus assembly ATPase PilU